jgi:hypothetical protein
VYKCLLQACLQVAAAAERVGGVGRIMAAYNGFQPSVDAVKWMNFDKQYLGTILYFPLCELSYMQEDLALLDSGDAGQQGQATSAVTDTDPAQPATCDAAVPSEDGAKENGGSTEAPDSETCDQVEKLWKHVLL